MKSVSVSNINEKDPKADVLPIDGNDDSGHMDVSALMDLLDKNKQTSNQKDDVTPVLDKNPANRLGLSVKEGDDAPTNDTATDRETPSNTIIRPASQEEKLQQIRNQQQAAPRTDELIRSLKHSMHNNRSTKKTFMSRLPVILSVIVLIGGLSLGMVYFINKQTESWSEERGDTDIPAVQEPKNIQTTPKPLKRHDREELLDIFRKE